MSLFRSLGKLIWGDPDNPELVQIPSGSLYLIRPNSIKGPRECIFLNAQASVRRTSAEFHYQLVISKVIEEGEELIDDLEGEDEKVFLIDESIRFREDQFEGCTAFAWKDPSGEPDDCFEFVCEIDTTPDTAKTFEVTVFQCMYERKNRKSHFNATDQEIQQFVYVPKKSTPPSTPTRRLRSSPSSASTTPVRTSERTPRNTPTRTPGYDVDPSTPTPSNWRSSSATIGSPAELQNVISAEGELHIFDGETAVFLLHSPRVTGTLQKGRNYDYFLRVEDDEKTYVAQTLEPNMNAVFNKANQCLIWCYYDEHRRVYSWLFRFSQATTQERFKKLFGKAMYETLNETSFSAMKPEDQMYVIDVYEDDVEMMDAEREEESDAETIKEEETESEYEDSDEESQHAEQSKDENREENSQLAVGYKHNRSFVVRGNSIGVFKTTEDDRLEFAAAIGDISKSSGKSLFPSQVMLHEEDTSMVLMDEKDPHSLYKMDLEYGKVVEEWNVHEDIQCANIVPTSKFAQMSGEKTLLGMSHNALYRIDPRLSGQKLVDSECRQYATKNDFTSAATDEKGHIVLGSDRGDVKLFTRAGQIAKTNLANIGNPIIGVDVTADGQWVIATCREYLLLIDTRLKSDQNHRTGFEKSFAKDEKPRPLRLMLRPEHVQMMGMAVDFTPARFNTGSNELEKTIVSSTGPYVITWNFRQVKQGKIYAYYIKCFNDKVVADNFKYGGDRAIVVALPHDVALTRKQALKQPTKSVLSPKRGASPRSNVVNSPW